MTSGGVLLEEEKKWCVYIHRNIINNKAYIGIAKMPVHKRWGKNGNGYKKTQKVFYRAIQKYGWGNFEHIIWCENLSQKEAKKWEMRLIALFQTNCCRYKNPEFGYNMTDGGDGLSGFKFSEESKEKMRKPHPTVQGENHPNYGKHLSKETKIKIGNSNKGKIKSEDIKIKLRERFSGKNNPMYGIHLVGEKNGMFGIKQSEESKRKMSENHVDFSGTNNPNYGKGKNVVQLSLTEKYLETYISVGEAYQITGISKTAIYGCCNHQYGFKTAGGFKWMFRDEYEKLNNINGGNNNE